MYGELMEDVDKTLGHLFKDLTKKLKVAESKEEREHVFDSLEYRLRFLADTIVSKAKWYVYAKTCHELGVKKIYVHFAKDSEDRKKHDYIVYTDNFGLDNIPAFHAYCSCTLGTRK